MQRAAEAQCRGSIQCRSNAGAAHERQMQTITNTVQPQKNCSIKTVQKLCSSTLFLAASTGSGVSPGGPIALNPKHSRKCHICMCTQLTLSRAASTASGVFPGSPGASANRATSGTKLVAMPSQALRCYKVTAAYLVTCCVHCIWRVARQP
jgi:hypothetical protein